MTRRALLAAAFAPAGIRAALIESPEGDHLTHFRRLASRDGVAAFQSASVQGASKMMAEFRPTVVAVSTEPLRMPEAVEIALRGGAHVIVEKPGCTKLDQFERMAKLASETNRNLMLAMATRLDPAAVQARHLVHSGWIGSLYGVTMRWVADQTRLRNPAHQQSWKVSKERGGGGKLIFHGIHFLDLVRYITDRPITRVSAFCRNVGGTPGDVEDAAVVSLEFQGGALGTLNTGYYLDRGYDNEIRLWGSHGWLRFNPHAEASLESYSTHPQAPRGVQQFRPPKQSAYDLMFQSAVDARQGKRPWFISTQDSLDVLRVVFASYRSAETGRAQNISRINALPPVRTL